MIAAPSALAAAYEQTHSQLFDLADGAPSVVALAKYRKDPVRFCVEVLRIPEYRIRWSLNAGYVDENGVLIHQWDGTVDPLVAMLEGLAENCDVCVEAGTGTQKSFNAACAVLWFLACWEGAIVKTFAPSEEQLRAYMWMEIGKLWPSFSAEFPSALLLDLEIRMRGGMDNSWGAAGVSVKKRAGEEVSVGAQGMHAPHMLLVYEETPGIEYPVITAGENTCTAPHNIRLAVGNPDHKLDTLHQFGFDKWGKPHEGMRCIRISALDHPNVVAKDADIVPGAVSTKSVKARWNKYVTVQTVNGKTETVEGRLYTSRVRGMSPDEAAEALIKLAWVRRAQQRWLDKQSREILEAVGQGKKSLGVDVANSEGGDEAAIARGIGAVLVEVDAFPCPDANNLGFKVFLEMRDKGIDVDHVGVDGVGVGAGAVNELRKRDKYIRNLIGGARPEGTIDEEDWNNLRSQIQWTLREDLRTDQIALPPDEEMAIDLITATWEPKNGKICVESKETLCGRLPGGRSPNKGDAVAYWNFVRPRDPVVSDTPDPKKVGQTVRQRVMAELKAMEAHENTPPKKYFGVMRQ